MSTNLLHSTTPREEWATLVPLDTPNLPRINLGNLPSWAGDFARALSAATETPPELAVGMVLATCATATARRMQVNVKPGYVEPCNLWIVVALPPGNRKSAVQSAATKPLLEWEQNQAEIIEPEVQRLTSEYKTLEARANEARKKSAKEKNPGKAKEWANVATQLESELPDIPKTPQIWTSDATPERLGSLLAEQDECIAWLSSEGGVFDLLQGRYSKGIPNLDLVLKAHSGDSERVDRGSRPPVFLRYPRLSIGLSPQPEVLRGLATKPGFRGRGLLARFLYLSPPSPLGYRDLKSTPIPQNICDAYSAGIFAMLDWNVPNDEESKHQTHVLNLSTEAHSEWHSFSHAIEIQMRPGGNMEHFTDFAGKAPGAAARLAGVLHCIKHAHGKPWDAVITAETMIASLEIMSVITRHSLAAFGIMGADPSIAAAKHVMEWIERGRISNISEREIFNALRGKFSHMKNLRFALEVLEERGYIEIRKLTKDGPGRRPSPIIWVRQEIREGWQ